MNFTIVVIVKFLTDRCKQIIKGGFRSVAMTLLLSRTKAFHSLYRMYQRDNPSSNSTQCTIMPFGYSVISAVS